MQTVFHVSSPDPRDRRHATTNVVNPLDDDASAPDDEVVIVANGAGVRMFVAPTAANRELAVALDGRGVALSVCVRTLDGKGVGEGDFLPGVERVSTGVTALARLRDEGYGSVNAP